jgi:hypothetical protein
MKIKKNAKPAHNKQYALRALFAPSGFEKPQSATPLCVFLSPTFQPTKKPSVFSYKVGWNVSYLERYATFI